MTAPRYLTEAECARFGGHGHQNECTPVKVEGGRVLSLHIYTQHASGYREPRLIEHGHRTYGRLVDAIERGEV